MILERKQYVMLAQSPKMDDRLKVAKDPNAPTDILNKLVHDPTENVAYHANLNPSCTKKRLFKSETIAKCVPCDDNHIPNPARCGACNKPKYVENKYHSKEP